VPSARGLPQTLAIMSHLRTLLIATVLCASLHAKADEYYEFHRITCDSELPAFQIERVGYWNIKYVVWPAGGPANQWWQSHVTALKHLESKNGLYVLDAFYGHFDQPNLSWQCGPITATVSFQRVPRPDESPPRYVRMHPRLTITVGKTFLVSDIALSPTRVRAYQDYMQGACLEVCHEGKCQDILDSATQPLSDARLRNLFPR